MIDWFDLLGIQGTLNMNWHQLKPSLRSENRCLLQKKKVILRKRMLGQDQFLAQVGSRVAGLPGAHGLTLRARSPGGPRAGFPQHTRREGKLLRDAGRIWVNQWETKGRILRCG